MISAARLDQLAAKVAHGTALSTTEAMTLIHSIRQLHAERAHWPRPKIATRLKRTAKTGSRASPLRYSHVPV